MAKRVNSCVKGKKGELKLVHYLREQGFTDARRTQQHNGAEGKSDVVCEENCPNLHIECKYGVKKMALGNQSWLDACDQAANDSDGAPWVLMWKPHGGQQWFLTHFDGMCLVTLATDLSIGNRLLELGGRDVQG